MSSHSVELTEKEAKKIGERACKTKLKEKPTQKAVKAKVLVGGI